MVYETLLVIGVIGFIAMSALGLAHGSGHAGGHDGHVGHVGDAGHAGHVGDVGHVGHVADASLVAHVGHAGSIAHSGHAGHAGHAHDSHHNEGGGRPWWLISPLAVFSVCLGAGGFGMLFQRAIAPPVTAVLALVVGILFNVALVKPVTNLVLAFGAKPSEGLEGSVATTAEAVSNFDEKGRGVVCLTLDGQLVQLLGSLDPAEAGSDRVRKGDRLVVLEVDAHKNECRVTKELNP